MAGVLKLMHGGLFSFVACCLSHQQEQNTDLEWYYTMNDMDLLANNFSSDLAFLTMNWRYMLGRPTVTMIAHAGLMGNICFWHRFNFQNFTNHKNVQEHLGGSLYCLLSSFLLPCEIMKM